jgi:hypothetical protein
MAARYGVVREGYEGRSTRAESRVGMAVSMVGQAHLLSAATVDDCAELAHHLDPIIIF